MPYNQLKMYDFNTKIYSDTTAPFRVSFRLSSRHGLPYILPSSYYMVLNNLAMLNPHANF